MQFVVYIMSEGLEKLTLTGQIEGKRDRGKQRVNQRVGFWLMIYRTGIRRDRQKPSFIKSEKGEKLVNKQLLIP